MTKRKGSIDVALIKGLQKTRHASSQMIFDYGWDGLETFMLDHVSGAAKDDCVVLDAGGNEVTKIPAKSKIGLLGDITYKFTTKDKVYTYETNLVTAPLARYLPDGSIDWKESGRGSRALTTRPPRVYNIMRYNIM